MMKQIKRLAFTVLVSLSLLGIQAHSSQAADERFISIIQPDGVKKLMKVNFDQRLSELREMLMGRGADITPDDKISTNMGEISPRDETAFKVRDVITDNALSFKPRGSLSQKPFEAFPSSDPLYLLVKKIYVKDATYSSGVFRRYREGATCSTYPLLPQKGRIQAVLSYEETPIPERVLKKVLPGQDGRTRIQDTTSWPHSIHAHLGMKIHGDTYMGSGVIVGPHHLLTCAHCVYNLDEGAFFEEISVYPALNDKVAPFNKVKATRAYLFKAYQGGDERFDMALLLLEQSIGDYTGWGGLLSAADTDLSQETVHITGYPGDKGGGKQMWSMSHRIKTVKPEVFDYEIDTYGGQSGSPVWINKYGTPLVLGVHTMGKSDVNSGVRLSASKFEKIFEVIRDTYVLGGVDGLDLGSRLVLGSSVVSSSTTFPASTNTPVTVNYTPPRNVPSMGVSPSGCLIAPPSYLQQPMVPLIARGHEAIYQTFLNGALIYTDPQTKNKITLPIRDLSNPLEGTFDLSHCGDTGKYLSISTGYRKGKRPENASKIEIWFAPRFQIEKELNGTAAHFKPIMGNWKQEAHVGMFWTWGGWDSLGDYDYLTTEDMDNLSKIDLYERWKRWGEGAGGGGLALDQWYANARIVQSKTFMFRL